MKSGRLEAFSDGVIAIIITIMVLELRPPESASLAALGAMAPKFAAYLLSFVYVAIYWNNHHHLLHTVERVNGAILWANNHLLFWLSLVPFVTAWAGETGYKPGPVALYSAVNLMAGIAYFILSTTIVRSHGADSTLGRAVGAELKGRVSMLIYALSVPIGFFVPLVSIALLWVVAIMWIVPDRRIEREMERSGGD